MILRTTPWLLALLAIGCDPSPPPPARRAAPAASATAASAPACTFGADQTCNDDPLISSIHGACRQDGTCECHPGFARNPSTGRCR